MRTHECLCISFRMSSARSTRDAIASDHVHKFPDANAEMRKLRSLIRCATSPVSQSRHWMLSAYQSPSLAYRFLAPSSTAPRSTAQWNTALSGTVEAIGTNAACIFTQRECMDRRLRHSIVTLKQPQQWKLRALIGRLNDKIVTDDVARLVQHVQLCSIHRKSSGEHTFWKTHALWHHMFTVNADGPPMEQHFGTWLMATYNTSQCTKYHFKAQGSDWTLYGNYMSWLVSCGHHAS